MNRSLLTEDDIARGKNFNQLLKNYQAMKVPFFKAAKFWYSTSAIIVAGVAAVIIYNKVITAHVLNTAFINPPMANADIKIDSYVVNAQTDSTIVYPSGSKIHIPANAFLDAKGDIVKGNVDLHYREFKKISEAFLAGIPMTYDSAGEKFHFESAGMMEIGATQNGSPLKTNPAAPITVDMVSNNSDDRFNTYYLDTIEKKWKYLAQKNFIAKASNLVSGTDTSRIDSVSNKDAKTEASERSLKEFEKQKPVMPQKQTINKPSFSIKVDEKEFPEIAVYRNIKFQVEDKTYNPAKADELWESVDLKRIEGTANYEITFSKAADKYTVIATPVFADKDYAAAKNMYEEKFKQYQTTLNKRKENEAKLKAENEARAKGAEEKMKKEIAEQEARIKQYEANMQQSDLMYRTFQVSGFGIWNCDCPSKLPSGENVTISLQDAKTKNAITVQYCCLVEKGRNAMFTYYGSPQIKNFRFDPSKQNMVWVVTSDYKIAIVKPDEFKTAAMAKKDNSMQLKLNIIDKHFKSSDEAKEYLEI